MTSNNELGVSPNRIKVSWTWRVFN